MFFFIYYDYGICSKPFSLGAIKGLQITQKLSCINNIKHVDLLLASSVLNVNYKIRKIHTNICKGLTAILSGTPIPLDTHPPEQSSPWNTHPLEHPPPWNFHPPLTPTPPPPPELPSPWNIHPPQWHTHPPSHYSTFST